MQEVNQLEVFRVVNTGKAAQHFKGQPGAVFGQLANPVNGVRVNGYLGQVSQQARLGVELPEKLLRCRQRLPSRSGQAGIIGRLGPGVVTGGAGAGVRAGMPSCRHCFWRPA